jgi:hypothetical protein
MSQEMILNNNNSKKSNKLTELIIIEEEENYDDSKKICAPIYRFKFTEEFMEELYKFSKIHQYDHRKDFKEAWELWVDENNEIIQEEIDRLHELGYDGDILDKMFKSARYYFRKKSPVKTQPKKRRPYITVNHNLLDAMDTHIELNIGTENYQPKTGFASFYIEYEELITEAFRNLNAREINDRELIENKLKKTYKNRYFMIVSK